MKILISVVALSLVLASSGYSQDSVQVKTGWNIIGSVKAGAVPDVLSTTPDSLIASAFFGFAPDSGYRSTDTLGKGIGYWIKVKADGIIIFNTTPPVDSCKSKAFIYQGKFYNTVSIGDQCWMAENLDVGTIVTGVTNQTDNDTLEKYCYDNEPLNCGLYGGLYQWNEAMQYVTTAGAQGICPTGWHIPTIAEYETFRSAAGGDGNALKAVGQGTGGGAGTNTSGFSALLTGFRDYVDRGNFYSLGLRANFWISTEFSEMDGLGLSLWSFLSYVDFGASGKDGGFSVRCLED